MWWPGISDELEARVRNCQHCQDSQQNPPLALLHPWEGPNEPWTRLHLHFAGPFQGYMFLVVVDAGSKCMEVIPMATTSATATVAELRALFSVHRLPERVVTDNGPQFTSQEFQQFLQVVNVPVAPYHPSSNGLAERAVQTFKQGLRWMTTGTLDEKLYRIIPQANLQQSYYWVNAPGLAQICYIRTHPRGCSINRTSSSRGRNGRPDSSPKVTGFVV